MKILTIKDGYKTYGKNAGEVIALQGINLDIEEGEFVVILGPSGSGKSTLLNMMSGIDLLSEGDVLLAGNSFKNYNDEQMSKFRRETFGFIFQSFQLLPNFTVYENIITPILLSRKKVDQDFIEELMKLLGLTDKKMRYPSELSGGEQQRVAIGRALANQASIIFADEPTGNLDVDTGKQVLNLLLEGVKKYKRTLIMVTHNEAMIDYADRVIYVENGRIKEKYHTY